MNKILEAIAEQIKKADGLILFLIIMVGGGAILDFILEIIKLFKN